MSAVRARIAALAGRWPGLDAEEISSGIHIAIPERFRVGHEAHFAQVANRFFEYVRSPESMPPWERSYMLAKYYVTTRGVELSQVGPAF